LLTYPALFIAVAMLVAAAALAQSRLTAGRLERLAESYSELRYEHSHMRSRLAALELAQRESQPTATAAQMTGATAFVPLSSLKR
jgi:hypothetical protein